MNQLDTFLNSAPEHMTKENNNIYKFKLEDGNSIRCVLWEGEYYITGMDIIRSLIYKIIKLGRVILNQKKLEEGIFSDLRNLKPGIDCKLETSHSPFLRFLHKNDCIRTQKKQKVFFWNSVPHTRMLNDILDRDIKREALNLPTTTTLIHNNILTYYSHQTNSSTDSYFYMNNNNDNNINNINDNNTNNINITYYAHYYTSNYNYNYNSSNDSNYIYQDEKYMNQTSYPQLLYPNYNYSYEYDYGFECFDEPLSMNNITVSTYKNSFLDDGSSSL